LRDRPNAFLKRQLREQRTPAKTSTSWFQQARDWTAFVVSITSLFTAALALKNTLQGPLPFLAGSKDVTIFRSSQFRLGNPAKPATSLRDETGQPSDFPLVIIQPALSNRAQPPNGIGVREITGELSIKQGTKVLFSLEYFWFRTTESTSQSDPHGGPDTLVFTSAAQSAPFDLTGGSTWSREILFSPIKTFKEKNWQAFSSAMTSNCTAYPTNCSGVVEVRVRLNGSNTLISECVFDIDDKVLSPLQGKGRKYFTSSLCAK
jgi:hypothetical protein